MEGGTKMNAIALQGFDDPIIISDSFEVRKGVLFQASRITKVGSLPSEEMAVEALTKVQRLLRDVESSRKEVKEKPLALGRKIDSLAKEFCEPLIKEEMRLKVALGEFAEVKRQEALEAERIRQKEIQRQLEIQREQEEKAQAAALAQAQAEALALQAQREVAKAVNEVEKEAARFLAVKAQMEAEAQAKRLAEAAMEAQKLEDAIRGSAPVAIEKAAKAVTKFKLMYRVDDMNALFASHPHVCEITEKKSAVNMLINGLQMVNPDVLPKVPGLHIWREADVSTRSR